MSRPRKPPVPKSQSLKPLKPGPKDSKVEIPKSFRFRRLVSVCILLHLVAVFVPPLAFQSRGRLGDSHSIETLMALVRGYSQFLYIDRGYAFFAPNPGPSHLIQAAISDVDDHGKTAERMIPNLDDQWPRLLYHRHFMLAEFLNEIHQPQEPPVDLATWEPEQARRWQQSRDRYVAVRDSIIAHLEHQNPGKRIRIRRLEHMLPNFVDMINDPIELNDPRLYRVLADPVRVPADATQTNGQLPNPSTDAEEDKR